MSHAKKDIKFSLKATVNMKKRKVLFAQVDSAFADVLLSFLTLPLGTIVKILNKHCEDIPPQFGSITSLYSGLANLDSVHFWGGEGAKSILLHPRSSFDADRRRLKLDISDSPPLEYLNCPLKCKSHARFQSKSMYFDKPEYCRYCRFSPMEREVAKNEIQTAPCDDGVFMKKTSSFLITDDLHIMPNAGLLQISRVLGDDIDMDEAETLNVTFELHEVLKLLVFSLISMNPLSVIILDARLEYKKGTEFTENVSNYNSKKMNLKLMVQKSTKKLLYAEAEEDFVDFLFSFLIIPLGGAENLLVRKFCNSRDKAIDNLYMSAIDCIHDKYYKHPDAKNWLMKPNIPHGYILKNHILLLTEEELPEIYRNVRWRSTNFPKGQGSYLIGPRTYKVTDDLTVTPFCIVSIISNLNENKIPMSDVEEVELQIGLKECLSILKASLTSKCAITGALLSQTMTKKPKTESSLDHDSTTSLFHTHF